MGACDSKSNKKDNIGTRQYKENEIVKYGDKDIKIDPGVFVTLKNGKISDKYKIGSTLGEGAFGVV